MVTPLRPVAIATRTPLGSPADYDGARRKAAPIATPRQIRQSRCAPAGTVDTPVAVRGPVAVSSQMKPTRTAVLGMAVPFILANTAVPLLGIVDTAVIGHTGSPAELGAIALGGLLFNFVFWSFGFLRMGTTGFVAQAAGRGDEAEVRAIAVRAVLLAVVIGVLLIALQVPIAQVAFRLLGATEAVEHGAAGYFQIRIFGAPASLSTFALLGVLIGLGESRKVLVLQLFLNGLNIALDLLFAGYFDMGVRGIALGTAISDWATVAVAVVLVVHVLRVRHTDDEPFLSWRAVRRRAQVMTGLFANFNIMVRTLFLVFGFAWFTNQGAGYGDVVLAGNHVLLQFLALAAFFLDGFANVVESMAGKAFGARVLHDFDDAVKTTTELAAVTALLLGALVMAGGGLAIGALTDLPDVVASAREYLPYAAVYIVLSFAAFQLDGVFIGTSRTADMRNASILSALVFVVVSRPLSAALQNEGLWLAFILYLLARAVVLLLYLPGLRRSMAR